MHDIKVIRIDTPKDCNVIILTTHFIKSTEDIYEALVSSVPGIKFGFAFCEASGPCLVRKEGTDAELVEVAAKEALKLGAGHSAIIFLRGCYPINVLNAIKNVPEVCSIHTATANPVDVVVIDTEKGRGILGVVDGERSKGIETEVDREERKAFLRKIGYKL